MKLGLPTHLGGLYIRIDSTHRLHCSSFLGLPYRILNISHKKERLWSLWVTTKELAGRMLVPIPTCILDLRKTLLNNFNRISGSIIEEVYRNCAEILQVSKYSKAFGMCAREILAEVSLWPRSRLGFRVLGFRALGVGFGVWGVELSLLGWNPQTRTSSLQTCGGDSSGNYVENALNTRILSSRDLRRRRYPERIF